MALGDFFRPDPPIHCPYCAGRVDRWEGFDGPGNWLVWQQGRTSPIEVRRPTGPAQDARLPDGQLAIFGACGLEHLLLARIEVDQSCWVSTRLVDADGDAGLRLVGSFRLFRGPRGQFSVAQATPTASRHVLPTSVTAIGMNDACIVATRRTRTRDPAALDEWWVVDIGAGQTRGPIPDSELDEHLRIHGLEEPEMMRLPEELR